MIKGNKAIISSLNYKCIVMRAIIYAACAIEI